MTRKRKMLYNTASALIYQVIAVLCGFVLPKILIPYYGSSVNGLINSITNFMSFITLCECGVGAVVQSALYKPLADKDDKEISKVVVSSKRFFNKILILLSIYIVILLIVYPRIVGKEFGLLYTALLILILAFQYIAQYYLFLTYRLLLNADQLSFVQLLVHSIALIINTIMTVLLVHFGATIHVVKLASAIIFFIQPVILKMYVDRHYDLNLKIRLTEEPIKQKWNGFAQHIASVILSNTDVAVLTVFSSLQNISIYNVYYLVANGLRQLFLSAMTGVQALLGNIYAKGEKSNLQTVFSLLELTVHTVVTLVFTVSAILIIPFVRVYTKNFIDANYIAPIFAILLVSAYAAYTIRLPYDMMVKAAGHYRETQASAIVESVINVIISITFVFKFGLIGVAIGTLVAMVYRTIYFVIYLSKNIIRRPIKYFIKHIIVDFLCMFIMIFSTKFIELGDVTYLSWIIMAIQVMAICLGISICINTILYKSVFRDMFIKIKNKFIRHRTSDDIMKERKVKDKKCMINQ